jgi:hypothetical protein
VPFRGEIDNANPHFIAEDVETSYIEHRETTPI